MEDLIHQAESVLRTWESSWSLFISASLREEAIQRFSPLGDLLWHSDGGHPSAERQRMRCMRYEEGRELSFESAPIYGIEIEGNFLFDRAKKSDFRKALEDLGVGPSQLGDIWLRGDRGAQGLCTPEAAVIIDGCKSMVREVEISFKAISKEQLQLPIQRVRRKLTTVEASTRIDAIASAGFGLSRSKVVSLMSNGLMRLNWNPTKQISQSLAVGDRIQLEDRGTLTVISLSKTKRDRWRVELLRE